MLDVNSLLPDDPDLQVVATQNLLIQHAASDIQEYFPVICTLRE